MQIIPEVHDIRVKAEKSKRGKEVQIIPERLAITGQSFFLRMNPQPTHRVQLIPATIGCSS